MSSKKKNKFNIAESVSIAFKIQFDKFLKSDESELKFPTFLSAAERGFIHQIAAKYGLKSKSTGKGENRFITIYKRLGSTIIQNDARLILDGNMRCSISDLMRAYPITSKEKDDLSACVERSIQIQHKTMGHLNNGVAQVPSTTYNGDCLEFRKTLPIYINRVDLLKAINQNQVVVIAGETGSGKTTQLPQLVLEYCQQNNQTCRMLCTQPRRISAITVAERVSYERNEKIGQSIGYQIRLESRVSPKTVLTYCTNGVLLRTLMGGENALSSITHIFVDEVHERDKFSDFLLIALRDNLVKFKDLKVILMSATIDTQIFSRYFNNCPIVRVSGRLFDVQRLYLEDLLKLTQYRNKKMDQIENDRSQRSGDSKTYNKTDSKSDACDNVDIKQVEILLDPILQSDMNEFLEECYRDGSLDSFCQILYMYVSEGVPVDCQHSVTGMTGLMAAAHHGLTETAQQIIKMGADLAIKDNDGRTAYDYATQANFTECSQVLLSAAKQQVHPSRDSDDETSNDQLLDIYLQSIHEDIVDYGLILAAIKHIHLMCPPGSILVFLPGYEDIVAVRDAIQSCPEMTTLKYQIFTLHSNMATVEQKRVLQPLSDTRKIIVSTNIAETSITIDDVVYVIDSCKVKEKYYESMGGICSLQTVWTSKASCQQRAGRAGRTQPGMCFHLVSKKRFQNLPQNSVPEILRVPLAELCLHTKLLAPGNTPIADFLAKAIEPPSFPAVRNSVGLLKTIGALTATEDLTEMGRHLLDLTVEPKLGKMLLYACILKCLDPILTIVCTLSHKEPFQISMDPMNRKRTGAARAEFAADSLSDHMVLLRAFQAWQTARANGRERAFCSKNLISGATMETIVGHRSQLLAQLRASGLVKARGSGDIKDVNFNSEKWHIVKAALVAGLYPSLARVDRDNFTLRTSSEVNVGFHPSSTIHKGGSSKKAIKETVRSLPSDWLAFEEITRTGRFCFIRCNTLVTPLTVAFFGGPLRLATNALTQRANPPGLSSDSDSEEENGEHEAGYLSVDEWTTFKGDAGDLLAIFLLRQKFSAMVIRRLSNPGRPTTPLDEHVLSAVVNILAIEEKNYNLSQPVGIGQRPKPPLLVDTNWRNRTFDGTPDQQSRNSFGWQNNVRQEKPNVEPENKYFIIKVEEPHTLDQAVASRVYVFTSATHNKIMKAKNDGFKVIVFFSSGGIVSKFIGAAVVCEPHRITPTAQNIEWLCVQHVPYHLTRHIINNLNENRRVAAAREGQELCPGSGKALLALMEQFQRRCQRGNSGRPIQKQIN